MNDHPRGLSGFLAELKRRHVFRTLLAYSAVAFVVLQAAEIVLPAFGFGDWALQLTVVLAVIGCPVVLALAWVYEITPRGIRTMKELDAEGGRRLEEGNLLPRLALLAVTVMAAGAAGAYWVRTSVPGAEAGSLDPAAASASPAFQPADGSARDVPVRSLAVLPLQSWASPSAGEAGAAEGDYFAAGMHEALISQLSRLGSSFRVISRTTVQQYDATGRSIAQIGDDLGVEGVVEGSVVLDEDRVRITVQLIHAPSDTHIWSADYERELEDIIALQREVATAIARAIMGELDPAEREVLADADAGAHEADPDAAMAEMKGRAALSTADEGDEAAVEEARRHFAVAVGEDSAYAPALVGLAGSTLMRELSDGVVAPEVMAEVRTQVEKAVRMDPANAEARDLANLLGQLVPQPPGGGRHPPVPPVTTDLGARIFVMSHGSDVAASARDAQLDGARTLRSVGRVGKAQELLEGLVERFPDFEEAWQELEHLLVGGGRVEEVVALRQRRSAAGADAVVEGGPTLEALRAAVERQGLRGYWQWRREDVEARERAGREVPELERATVLAAVGERDRALDALRSAAEKGADLRPLRSDPTWDPYRRDPRFVEVLRQVFEQGYGWSFESPGREGGRTGR